jgi:hypothetical protein
LCLRSIFDEFLRDKQQRRSLVKPNNENLLYLEEDIGPKME